MVLLSIPEGNCCVCLESLSDLSCMVINPCSHVLHSNCSSGLDSCPLCRGKIIIKPPQELKLDSRRETDQRSVLVADSRESSRENYQEESRKKAKIFTQFCFIGAYICIGTENTLGINKFFVLYLYCLHFIISSIIVFQ